MPNQIKKIYDFLGLIPSITNSQEQKHKDIRRDLGFVGAVINGDLLSVKGINLKVDPSRVIETVHEVLLRDDYSFIDKSIAYVMIDIGMNVGLASLCKANNPKFTMVYGFEPLNPTFKLAQQNIDLNPGLKSKIATFNFGLSDHDEELEINFTEDHIMSVSSESTFDKCFEANVTREKIIVKNAATVIEPLIMRHKRQNNEKIFLKIDCEGAEFKIIKNLDAAGLLKEVDVAIVEWHGREPDEILNVLRNNGFFCFKSCLNLEWNVGLIKAVKII